MPITTHGHARNGKWSPEYTVWASMMTRCYKPNHKAFKWYGGKGITVCQSWRKSFPAFFADMGPRPKGFQIDRIDSNGNYEPSNCRWASVKTQHQNITSAVKIVRDGISYTAYQIAEIVGIPVSTVYKRMRRGWPVDMVCSPEKFKRSKRCL